MDNFLRLTNEGKQPNKKTNSADTFVDKERIQRLKRIFLPFWMRGLEEQKQNYNETSSTKRPSKANIEPK
jgi:hypothetical protein